MFRMEHSNSESELISIDRIEAGPFEGQYLLIIHDDPPPEGTGIQAPMLLDRGTRDWLRQGFARVDEWEQDVADDQTG